MLTESTVHLPISLAMLQGLIKRPDSTEFVKITLRWLHFVAGITWIGLLYFFNLINVPFQKGLDADTKKKVNPDLLGRTLWYFRWGAVVTVLVGLGYYVMYMLKPDVGNAQNLGHVDIRGKVVALVWLLIPIVTFFIEYLLIKKVPALTKDGRVYAVVALILFVIMAIVILKWLSGQLTINGENYASNKSLSIGVGGAMGVIMLLNVWGIIWPNNKRIIAATAGTGPAAPPELARQAFIASRTNAWLSLPMLLFMGTSHGDWLIFSGR
jgi:uncharacterized membrane protein